jgi:hypothetical protein
MTTTRVFGALTMVALLMSRTTVVAHHSYGGYDTNRVVEIEGVLEEFDWIAPHSLLKVRADDGRLYTAEWQAPWALQRRGVARDSLSKGDRIVISGNPRRDFDESGILNFKSVQRRSDGWQWPRT